MEITRSDEETRLDHAEAEMLRLRRIVDEVAHNAKAARETGSRPPAWPGQTIRRAELGSTAIGPTSSGTVGTGSVLLAVLISGTLYLVYPHITVPGVVNDTGGNVPAYSVVWITMVDGSWSIMHADCVTTYTAARPDQPH